MVVGWVCQRSQLLAPAKRGGERDGLMEHLFSTTCPPHTLSIPCHGARGISKHSVQGLQVEVDSRDVTRAVKIQLWFAQELGNRQMDVQDQNAAVRAPEAG